MLRLFTNLHSKFYFMRAVARQRQHRKTDFIDRLNHPNEIYRSGGFLVILEQQKAFVLEPLNYAFERFLIRSADGVQVNAAGQVG